MITNWNHWPNSEFPWIITGSTFTYELTNAGFHLATRPMWRPSPTNQLTTHGHDNSMRQSHWNLQRQTHCRFIRQRQTILNCRQNQNEMPKESTTTTYWFLWIKHNARLRGWQRITQTQQPKPPRLNGTGNATRWQSLLRRLLVCVPKWHRDCLLNTLTP